MSRNKSHSIGVYKQELKNKNALIFKAFGGLAVLLSIFDILTITISYKEPLFYIFAVLFRLLVVFLYSMYSPTAYQHFKYSFIVLTALVLPTILLGIYMYLDFFGILWTSIIVFVYGILLRLLYLYFNDTDIDYEKSAKNLLKLYPEPLDMSNNSFNIVLKKKQKKISIVNSMLASIASVIPIQALFAIPLISAYIAVVFLSKNGIAAGVMGMFLIVSIGFIHIGLSSYRNVPIFHEAQKILDEKEKKKKGKK